MTLKEVNTKNAHIPYLILQTAPAAEPLTLSETKTYLRVDNSVEDNLISSFDQGG